MNYKTYFKNLTAFHSRSGAKLTLDLLTSVCPHLTRKEKEQILDRSDAGESVYFAIPPLRINWSYQVLCTGEAARGDAPALYYAYAQRTRRSYGKGVSQQGEFLKHARARLSPTRKNTGVKNLPSIPGTDSSPSTWKTPRDFRKLSSWWNSPN